MFPQACVIMTLTRLALDINITDVFRTDGIQQLQGIIILCSMLYAWQKQFLRRANKGF